MASFLTALGHPPCVSSTWSSELRKIGSDAFRHNTRGDLGFWRGSSGIVVKSKGVRMMTVKSMGGVGTPKFKGTVMKEQQLAEMIEKKVVEAKQVCEEDERLEECKVAWDEVEEVSQAKADLRMKLEKQDPLEYYCQDNPETDECRVYED